MTAEFGPYKYRRWLQRLYWVMIVSAIAIVLREVGPGAAIGVWD